MLAKKIYDIHVQRDGRFWFIDIPALDGATQARNLGEVEEMARDYIVSVTGVDNGDFAVKLTVELPETVLGLLDTARKLREQEADARTRAAAAARDAARELHESGMTYREIGQVLEISHQRAQQLVSA